MEWDVPDTAAEPGRVRVSGAGGDQAAFPKARVVTVSECGSHAAVLAAAGRRRRAAGSRRWPAGSTRGLEEDWLLIADRNFYGWTDWCAAAGTGAALLWRVTADLRLPVLEVLPGRVVPVGADQPRRSTGKPRGPVIEAARRGEDLDPDKARYVRVIEYESRTGTVTARTS